MNKEVKELVRRLRRAGLSVVHSGGQHLTVRNEEGERVGTLPMSPSDHRSLKNCISDLRKRGVNV